MVDLSQTPIDTLQFSVGFLDNAKNIDLSNLPNLKYLSWGSNVNALDLSQNTQLERANIRYNGTPQVKFPANVLNISCMGWSGTSMDVSKCTSLQSLTVTSSDQLSFLDLTHNTNLQSVYTTVCPLLNEIRLPQSLQGNVNVSTEENTTVTYVP